MDLSFVFTPIYSIGHFVGLVVAKVVLTTSGVTLPGAIIDNVGLLTIVTILLMLANATRKVTWWIVTICWALVIIRIGLLMSNNTAN